jgi:broad specificity phosphatase PhoE
MVTDKKLMKLILIRHGETIENQTNICQGQNHGQLSQMGIKQAIYLKEELSKFKIDICFSSDLKRALDTSKIISISNGFQIIPDSRLRERNLGQLQGKEFPENWDSLAPLSGAETVVSMTSRIENFLNEIKIKYSNNTILIVSHGITITILISVCTGMNLSMIQSNQLPGNCSISILKNDRTKNFRLLKYNITNHLNNMPME